jgi:N-methylhydantoinase B
MPKTIDPVDLGIIWDRLISITDEVIETLVRSSFSSVVRESYDLSCVLFDARGRSIAQGTYSMPTFTGTAPMTLAYMLRKFPAATLAPGDVIITNDSWMGTGHLYDVNIARPIFKGPRLIGFTMSITHLPDIGGVGFSTVARDIYEEGLRLPICKLADAGRLNEHLLEIIATNVRVPDQVRGDLMANIACNEVGARLALELVEEYGLDDLDDVATDIIANSESALRRNIAQLPDGVWSNSLMLEGMGAPITLRCTVAKTGDEIAVDFAGADGPVRNGLNVPFCYSSALARYAVKCLTLPTIPNNEGSMGPVKVTAPTDCILNAQPPAATGGRHMVGHFVAPLVMGALEQALPDRVPADPGMIDILNIQGRGADGRAISSMYFTSGGFGALSGLDGAAAVPAPSNMNGISTEIWESLTNTTIERRAILPDTGGPGKFRGGAGQEFVMRNDNDYPLTISGFAQRTEFPPRGMQGGRPGATRRHLLDGKPVHSLGRYTLEPGHRLVAIQAGGGGFGDPFERDPESVLQDVRDGLVTVEGALSDYGVAVDLANGTATRIRDKRESTNGIL